jgi:hypothetical protein
MPADPDDIVESLAIPADDSETEPEAEAAVSLATADIAMPTEPEGDSLDVET